MAGQTEGHECAGDEVTAPQSVPSRPRVLLVDDHAALRNRVAAILAPTCDIVGMAGDGAAAFAAIEQLDPTAVALDVSLPGEMNGIEVAASLHRRNPSIRIVIYSADDDEEVRIAATIAGANAYILKMRLVELVHAVVG